MNTIEALIVNHGGGFLHSDDLVARIASAADFAKADPKTFYGRTEKGYTEHAALEFDERKGPIATAHCRGERSGSHQLQSR